MYLIKIVNSFGKTEFINLAHVVQVVPSGEGLQVWFAGNGGSTLVLGEGAIALQHHLEIMAMDLTEGDSANGN
jgi:hypothetical protein